MAVSSPARHAQATWPSLTKQLSRQACAACGAGLQGANGSRERVPSARWNTHTFIAGLRCHALTAPWVSDGAMNREAFDPHVETRLAATLNEGDVVILDNLDVHESHRAGQALAARGAWFVHLPECSPDLNPIEMASSKLEAHLRAAAARNHDELWKSIGKICNPFPPNECWNLFKTMNHVAD